MTKVRRPDLSGYIKQKRTEAGMTQSELARILGYTPQFVTNWERGISSPPAHALKDLMKALKIPAEELLEILAEESMRYWKEVITPSKKKSSRRSKAS